MKVYRGDVDNRRIVGHAQISETNGPLLEVNICDGGGDEVIERFKISALTTSNSEGTVQVERVILLKHGQLPELLPGWCAI